MPKYFLILSIIVFSSYSQNYWLAHNSPTTKNILMCSFPDSVHGWVCGDSGLIMNTINSGENWIIQNSGINNYIIEYIYFLDNRTGWAICNDVYFTGTLILKTTNSGLNWIQTRFPDTTVILNVITFTDSLSGHASGETGQIFKTTNGGINWILCVIDTAGCNIMFPKKDIFFANAETGYACGGAIDFIGLIWKTTNRGILWSAYCLAPEPLNEVQRFSSGKIVAMGGDLEFGSNFVFSNNNGTNWSYGLTDCFGAVTGFSCRTPEECWAVQSFANKIAVNLDSMNPGSVWQCFDSPENSQLYDIEFLSPTLGWAFGKNGKIYKYNTAVISVSHNQNNLPGNFILYQNYPNPFNPVTLIKYSLPVSEKVRLKIYDVSGKLVINSDQGFKYSGTHSVEVNLDGFSSGVYFYKIEAGIFTESKKMVLVK